MDNPLIIIIRLLFSLYIYCIILRVLFEWMRADRNNTLAQSIRRITQPPLTYLGKFLPSATSTKVRTLILLVLAELAKLLVISLLYRVWPNITGFLGWAAFDLLNQLATLYIYVLFIHVILSWLMSKQPTPISYIVYTLTYRMLKALRRFIPTIKGFDLSPLVAILLIQLISSFIINPLSNNLMQLALS